MEEFLIGAGVPAIAVVVYWTVNLIKFTTNYSWKIKRFIPLIAAVLGMLCGLICFYFIPNILPTNNVIVALVSGAASGLSATGFHQIIKQAKK